MATLTVPNAPTPRLQLALTAQGLTAETYNPATKQAGTAPATQNPYLGLVGLRAGDVITNVVICVTTAGTSTAPTGFFVGLYDTAGTRLATSADLASDAILTSTGMKNAPLSAAYTVLSDGGYYLAVLKNGTFAGADVALMRGDVQGNVYLAGVSGVRRFATLSGAQTTLPTSGTLADVGTPFAFWLGVN